MKKLLSNFAKNESGATAIEYGLIAAGIAVVIIVIVGEVGDELILRFTDVRNGLQAN